MVANIAIDIVEANMAAKVLCTTYEYQPIMN